MVAPSLVASVVVLLPAMGLLYWHLRRYEGYFDQNRLFFALLVALFGGILLRWLEVFWFQFENPRTVQLEGPYTTPTLVYSFAYTAVGYAALETLAKTAILGFKKFRLRKDTAYYGVSAGLGFGALWVLPVMTMRPFGLQSADGHVLLTAPALVWDLFLFILAIGLLLSHAASAVWVGKGAGEGKLWNGAMKGTLWLVPALACYWLWRNTDDQVIPPLAALAWGVLAMWMADRKVLQAIVPPEVRDMVRRERRREARRAGREP